MNRLTSGVSRYWVADHPALNSIPSHVAFSVRNQVENGLPQENQPAYARVRVIGVNRAEKINARACTFIVFGSSIPGAPSIPERDAANQSSVDRVDTDMAQRGFTSVENNRERASAGLEWRRVEPEAAGTAWLWHGLTACNGNRFNKVHPDWTRPCNTRV